jgi:hypothetical protein
MRIKMQEYVLLSREKQPVFNDEIGTMLSWRPRKVDPMSSKYTNKRNPDSHSPGERP